MVVSMTLTPALMSVFGGLLFRSVPYRRAASARRAWPAPASAALSAAIWTVALLAAVTCIAGLLAVASWASRR